MQRLGDKREYRALGKSFGLVRAESGRWDLGGGGEGSYKGKDQNWKEHLSHGG